MNITSPLSFPLLLSFPPSLSFPSPFFPSLSFPLSLHSPSPFIPPFSSPPASVGKAGVDRTLPQDWNE